MSCNCIYCYTVFCNIYDTKVKEKEKEKKKGDYFPSLKVKWKAKGISSKKIIQVSIFTMYKGPF
jgi:hypothetical protein